MHSFNTVFSLILSYVQSDLEEGGSSHRVRSVPLIALASALIFISTVVIASYCILIRVPTRRTDYSQVVPWYHDLRARFGHIPRIRNSPTPLPLHTHPSAALPATNLPCYPPPSYGDPRANLSYDTTDVHTNIALLSPESSNRTFSL
ncbi:hypothetical protein QCA50_006553 [Cerrena zonata]|uniref:Uncharacterized protein n=1 Tax=Cerrena zonata TaxID=2478898 RepID=A0AAW0GF46_9APHY